MSFMSFYGRAAYSLLIITEENNMLVYYKHFLFALATVIGTGVVSAADGGGGASSYNKKLRGVITLASGGAATAAEARPPAGGTYDKPPVAHGDAQSATQREGGGGGPFKNSCLHGRFAYSNLADGAASISVGLFDGMGKVTQMDDVEANYPNPDGGRSETSFSFNWGTYEVYPNGRGVIYASFGAEGGKFFDPPAFLEFVVTNASGTCEIMNMDSFFSSSKTDVAHNNVGVAGQLIAPRWSKIADV